MSADARLTFRGVTGDVVYEPGVSMPCPTCGHAKPDAGTLIFRAADAEQRVTGPLVKELWDYFADISRGRVR